MNVSELNVPKQRMRLEVAYELISKVHSDICYYGSRQDDPRLDENTMEILRQILLLDRELEKYEK